MPACGLAGLHEDLKTRYCEIRANDVVLDRMWRMDILSIYRKARTPLTFADSLQAWHMDQQQKIHRAILPGLDEYTPSEAGHPAPPPAKSRQLQSHCVVDELLQSLPSSHRLQLTNIEQSQSVLAAFAG